MTANDYIIDASSLIELHRHNPIDIYPSVWKNIENLIRKGSLVSPKEVLLEIIDRDDQLAKWAKNQNNFFREPTEKQIKILRDLLKDYPALVKEDRKNDADGWIIALAVEMATGAQQTVVPVKRIVVTEEKIRGNQIKIPLVCQKYNIETIDVIDMFRIEGWKF